MRMSDWSSDVCSSDLEGERYKFGDVTVESDIRDLKAETLQELVRVEQGDWYDAQKIENTVDAMAEAAGLQGYAFRTEERSVGEGRGSPSRTRWWPDP